MTQRLVAGRYRLVEEIGRGGMGAVYRAHDRLLDREVALKLLSGSEWDQEASERLLHEAKAAGRLDHPRIVAVYDAGLSDTDCYIVMQLVPGRPLDALPELSMEQILDIAIQVCEALEHAHSRGIVHRDIKPANILVVDSLEAEGAGAYSPTQSGPRWSVKLADFGLARRLEVSELTHVGVIMGTVAFMSPEQIVGDPVDGRTDIYSLGIVLYRLLTGRLPFAGDDSLAVISQHLTAEPVSPRWYRPELPEALDHLVLRMLAKEPGQRPASAALVQRELSQLLRMSQSALLTADSASMPTAEVSLLERAARGRLVGREAELAELRRWVAQAFAGQGGMVLLAGEAGIGKTRLAQETGLYARLRGGAVLVGHCADLETPLPYLPFVEILRHHVRPLPDRALWAIPPASQEGVVRLLPELALRLEVALPQPALAPEVERLRLFEQLTQFFSYLAQDKPLVVVLEDLHWADDATLAFLLYLVRNSAGQRLLVIGTYRDVELGRRHPLNELLHQLNRERMAHRIPISRLDTAGVRAQLQSMFEEPVGDEFVAAIYRETEGNPFFVEEMVKSLLEDGKIYRGDGEWGQASLSEMELPPSIRATIGRRLEKLDEAGVQVLQVASVIGREFSFEILQQVLGEDEEVLLSVVDAAVRAQLIREQPPTGGESYRFQHALIQQTLYTDLNLRRRARLHQQVGEALEQICVNRYSLPLTDHGIDLTRPSSRAADLLDQLAYHFARVPRGSDVTKGVYYSRLAAEKAADVYAFDASVRQYETALELAPDERERFALLSAQEQILVHMGSKGDQAQVLAEMEESALALGDDGATAHVLMCKASFRDRYGVDRPAAVEEANRALTLCRSLRDRAGEASALRILGEILGHQGEFEASLKVRRTALETFHQLGDRTNEALGWASLGRAYRDLGDPAAALSAWMNGLQIAAEIGDRTTEGRCLNAVGAMSRDLGRASEAVTYFERSLAVARETGNRRLEAIALLNLGISAGWDDQWDESLGYYQAAQELYVRMGDRAQMADTQRWTAEMLLRAGRLDQALVLLQQAVGPLQEFGVLDDLLECQLLLGRVYLRLGRFEEARAALLEAETRGDRSIVRVHRLLHTSLGHLYRQIGDPAAAAAQFQEAVRLAELDPQCDPQAAAELEFFVAQTRFWQGGHVGAMDEMQAVLARRPQAGHARAYYLALMGEAALSLGDSARALELAARASREADRHPSADLRLQAEVAFQTHRIWRTFGRVGQAQAALDKAYHCLMQEAERIQDPDIRRSLLEQHPLARQVLAAVDRLGVSA